MRWYKSISDFEDGPFIGEVLSLYGPKGYYFLKWNFHLMTKHFDVFNPGCSRFLWSSYLAEFESHIKDARTIIKYLDFFQQSLEIFHIRETRHILLYCPRLEQWADEYALKVIAEIARNDKKIPHRNLLHERMIKHADKIEYEIALIERERNEK